ncbi:hypothetical protein P7K49_032107, partial [Saguinus oedipus]
HPTTVTTELDTQQQLLQSKLLNKSHYRTPYPKTVTTEHLPNINHYRAHIQQQSPIEHLFNN